MDILMTSPVQPPQPVSIAIINIEKLYTGEILEPEHEAEAIYIDSGLIKDLGTNTEILGRSPDRILDANGMTVAPGLIDCHVHPQIGDWTSRHKIADWIGGYGRAGVTTVVSQGAAHLQGRPRDGLGAKLLAMFSARAFQEYRPDGVKVMAGSVMLEPGLQEEDFKEMYGVGVRYVAEIGISGIKEPEEALPMVEAARRVGMRVSMHFGGPSLPGSRGMGITEALALRPDVLAHVNGGSTARPDEELRQVVASTDAFLEACYHGGLRQLLLLSNLLYERGQLNRLILGSDSPSAIGITPQATLRIISWLSGLTPVTVGAAFAAASGNAQKAFLLDAGTIAPGAVADILILDAPAGSSASTATEALMLGDMPGIAAIFQNGIPMTGRAFNCPFPNREVKWLQSG